jgi:hypothetical protein
MWFSTASVTSSRTPRRCKPVATVRRKSCNVHGAGDGADVDVDGKSKI